MNNDLSELSAIDYAFGGHILSAFDSVDAESGSFHFKQFMQKPAKEKVFRGEFQEPKEFVQSLQSYMAQAKEEGDKRYNQTVLPAIYYFRSLNMGTADADAGNLLLDEVIYNEDKTQASRVSMARVNLTYKVVFIAPDKPSVERLLMAWYFRIANHGRGGHSFPVHYQIGGEAMTMDCQIFDPKTLQAADLSLPKGEQRLFATECEYEVQAPVIFGEQVTIPDPIRWEFSVVPGFEGCSGRG